MTDPTFSTDARPRVALVILTMDQREVTLRCLRSLRRLTHPSFTVVLVDNGSRDGTGGAVAREFPEVRVHRSETNLGAARGRNVGAGLALEDAAVHALFFTDNDVELDPGCIEPLANALREPSVGLAIPKIRYLERPEVLDCAGYSAFRIWQGVRSVPLGQGEVDRGQHDRARDLPNAPGIVMIRRDTFERVGGYDEGFDPFMYEDADLALRIRKLGLRLRFVPQSVVFHKGSHTFGGGGYIPEYARVKGRNLMRLMRRHASPSDWLLFAAVGAPMGAAAGFVRELRRGNLAALAALARGMAAPSCREPVAGRPVRREDGRR